MFNESADPLTQSWAYVKHSIQSCFIVYYPSPTRPSRRMASPLWAAQKTVQKSAGFGTPLSGPILGSKSLPNGPQEPPKTLLQPSRMLFPDPFLPQLLSPGSQKTLVFNVSLMVFEKSCFPHRDPKKHSQMSPKWSPKVTQELSDKIVH